MYGNNEAFHHIKKIEMKCIRIDQNACFIGKSYHKCGCMHKSVEVYSFCCKLLYSHSSFMFDFSQHTVATSYYRKAPYAISMEMRWKEYLREKIA